MEKAILGHINMDFDCFASIIAAKKIHPDYIIVFPDNMERMVREYIKNEEIPFEYKVASNIKSNIEKVILVDNNNITRTGVNSKYLLNTKIKYIYDHHKTNGKNKIETDNYLYKPYGANITILMQELIKININLKQSEKKIFLLGIYEDTGFLTYVSLTKEDVKIFNYLFQNLNNIDLSFINKYLITDFNKQQLSIMDDLAKNADIFQKNNVKMAYCFTEREEFINNLAIVVQRLMMILSVDVIFVVIRLRKNIYFLARSNAARIDVKKIAEELGGGGHPSAAYALVKEGTFVEIKEEILNMINKYYITKKKVKSIMTRDVVSSNILEEVSSVKDKMIAYDLSIIPVVGDNEFGVITQKIIDRLANHGLSNSSIKDYVDYSIPIISPETNITKARSIIMKSEYPLALVVIDNNLIGIVSLEDLLKYQFPEHTNVNIDKNFENDLRYKLPKKIYKVVTDIGKISENLNFNGYIVGGVVRDIIFDRKNYDIDIVIEGDGIKVAKKVKEKYDVYLKVHSKFKTAVLDFDSFKIDIATARSETYQKPGALPKVMQSSLKYDLYRRDFTINAMAISIGGKDFGTLYDYFGGYQDLKNEIIKIMHNISFIEDPSRILRGVRFAARFNFEFDNQTKNLLKNAIELNMLSEISGRRIKDELKFIFDEDYPEKSFNLMESMGILEKLIPGVKFTKFEEKLFREVRHVLHWYKHLYLKVSVNKYFLYFYSVFNKLKLEKIEKDSEDFELTKKFKIFSQQIKTFMRKKYKFVIQNKFLKKSKIYKLFQDLQIETILFLTAYYSDNEKFQKYTSVYLIDIFPKTPIMDGKTLKDFCIKNGLKIKEILEDVKNRHINDNLESYEEALQYIKKSYLD